MPAVHQNRAGLPRRASVLVPGDSCRFRDNWCVCLLELFYESAPNCLIMSIMMVIGREAGRFVEAASLFNLGEDLVH